VEGGVVIGDALVGLLRWTVRRVGGRNLLLLGLLLLAVGSVALGTADRVRGIGPRLALTMAVLGALVGWILSAVIRSTRVASLVTAIGGLGAALLVVGRLGDEVLALSWAWRGLLRAVLRWAERGMAPEWRPVWQALTALRKGAATLLARVYGWTIALIAGEPIFDPVAVAFVWGLALWAVSAWAGGLICRRERPLWAVTPAGVLLMVAFSHVWGSHIYLLGLLLAGLLLMATASYDRRVRRWTATGVDYPELRAQTAAAAVFLSLALLATAYSVPSLSLRGIVDLARGTGGDRSQRAEAVAESLGMERQERTVFEEVQAGGLPRRHLLGVGPELSQKVVMVISMGDTPPGPPEATKGEPPRYYWRSHTYDTYTGSGWRTGETAAVEYKAGRPAFTETLSTQRTVRQEVQVVGDAGRLVHVAGTLVVADHDYRVAWRSQRDPFAATIDAKTYRADSVIPMVDEEGLRAEGSDYPVWVRERYLALPDTVPERVLVLGRDLTATEPTPYDRVSAIEAYLRRFPYTLDVPAPPAGRDVVDTFLFDLQRGYCDYYASAMVVLARAAGVPARLVVGYAPGTYDWTRGSYQVTEADAHAWPEVYFPSYGWVKFEPTAGLPAIERLAEVGPSEWKQPEGSLGAARPAWSGPAWWQAATGVVLLLGLVVGTWLALERRRLNRQQPLWVLASVYRELRRHGRRLAVPMRPGDTPDEFGVSLAGWLEGFPGEGRLRVFVATGARELYGFIELYVRSMYGPRSADACDRVRAIRLWDRLQWRLRVARLWQRARGGR
jgi:transglutaminase-like putative cysteine protease